MKRLTSVVAMLVVCGTWIQPALADDGSYAAPSSGVTASSSKTSGATSEPIAVSRVSDVADANTAASKGTSSLGQFPKAESAPLPQAPQGMDFPKVMTKSDEQLARKFAWWPSDAKPAPVKDEERSGYWWWPEVPGETRPWGNQGYIYVRKVIFDYKASEGEMKPSLVIKRVLKNVKVFFDYDKSDLRDDAIDALDKALYTLEKNPKTNILITGNADARGSSDYNIKLGERRAQAVSDYVTSKGLPGDRIKILSRGKLDAMAATNDLVGMQKDRNAQFMIAEVEEVMIPASKAELFADKIIEEKKEITGEVRVSFKDYTIQSGDSLWKIAEREYGNGMQWKRLYEFNKDVISNPDRPRKGTKIRIPIE